MHKKIDKGQNKKRKELLAIVLSKKVSIEK